MNDARLFQASYAQRMASMKRAEAEARERQADLADLQEFERQQRAASWNAAAQQVQGLRVPLASIDWNDLNAGVRLDRLQAQAQQATEGQRMSLGDYQGAFHDAYGRWPSLAEQAQAGY